ncbi:hypothetical protein [Mycobacterium sp.]|uniref:hypothetical protein n=1 Tax=Mycobacterium sp. TaxID=1785 RepID=UPI0033420363
MSPPWSVYRASVCDDGLVCRWSSIIRRLEILGLEILGFVVDVVRGVDIVRFGPAARKVMATARCAGQHTASHETSPSAKTPGIG